jgi:hypothetical protein
MEIRGPYFQNSPNPRVLLSGKINTIFLRKWFSHERRWVSNGYPYGIREWKKPSQCISENGMPMHADILFSIMPCTILCSVRASTPVLSMSIWIIKLNV